MLEEWAIESLSHTRIWNGRWTVYMAILHFLVFECSCIWLSAWRFLYSSCIFFGHGWMASLLHLLSWSSLRVAFCWCCPRLYTSNSNFYLWLFVSCFRLHIFFLFLFYSPFSSLPYLFAFLHFFIPYYRLPQPHFLYTRRAPSHPDRPIRLQEQ